jgi:ABC-type uncharacterized transport system substrate-binding protein
MKPCVGFRPEHLPLLMTRRDLVLLLGGAATWPFARQSLAAWPVVGFLGAEAPELWAARVRAFRQGLSEAGYEEGRNVSIEFRWAEGRAYRLPALARDLARRRVAVIAAPGGTNGALAAKAATWTIPIVFTTSGDPVQLGLVADLKRPAGNLTGILNLNAELAPKRLGLLKELVPAATSVALLVDPTNASTERIVGDVQPAASALGLQLHILRARSEGDLEKVFADIDRLGAKMLLIGTEGFLVSAAEQLAELTVRHRVPTMFQFRDYVTAGGLISYGGSAIGDFRQAGVYTGRILNGERPAVMPVQRSQKFELIINLKTAKALNLSVPPALLARADEVIDQISAIPQS